MSQLYSYSRIGCFFTCPQQYKHRYILKTPSPLPEGVELFMGSRFHEAMEFLYEQVPNRVPSLDEVLNRFEQVWEAEWKTLLFKQKQKGFTAPIRINKEGEGIEDYHHRARLFVEQYYEKYKPFDQDQTVKDGIERKVLFSLDPAGNYRMQGYIDRVARAADGTVVIHDYKTGSRKHNPGDNEKEDQLSLYQVGLSQLPEYKDANFRLQWHYVAFEDDVMEIRRTAEDLEGLKKTYIHKIQTIEKAKGFDPTPSALCGWCEFLPLCSKGQAEVERRRKRKEGSESSVPAPLPRASAAIEALPSTDPPAVPTVATTENAPPDPVAPNPAPLAPPPRPRKKSPPPPPSSQLPLFG